MPCFHDKISKGIKQQLPKYFNYNFKYRCYREEKRKKNEECIEVNY